jgi:hypothetical protein
MVLTKKDSEGKVIAWSEWRIVNEFGQECVQGDDNTDYKYAWINDVWINDTFRSKNSFNAILRSFIKEGRDLFPWLKYIYWNRGKYNRRLSCYEIRRVLHEPLQKI